MNDVHSFRFSQELLEQFEWEMWNVHSANEMRPSWWSGVDAVYKQISRPDVTTNEFQMNEMNHLCSISIAPKPPKKRFLEASRQLRQQQLQQQQQQHQQQQQQQQQQQPNDGSSLMQFAEMCFYYQKNGAVANRFISVPFLSRFIRISPACYYSIHNSIDDSSSFIC